MTLYRAKEGASFDLNGSPVFIIEGDIAEEGSPVLRSHGYLFEPIRVKFAGPPKQAESLPVNAKKPAAQSARSR